MTEQAPPLAEFALTPAGSAVEAAGLLPQSHAADDPKTSPHDHIVRRMPLIILHVHSDCNCRCTMCDIWKTRDHREVPLERVCGWLPELQALGVERVVLTGGEPLMHSRFPELMRSLHESGLAITVLSTGLLVRRHAEALARDCDELIVSLDGPAHLHNAIRNVPRAFERLAEGVRALRIRGGARPRITARCTVQRANCASLRATVDAARELGLDGVSFLAVDVNSEAFARSGPLPGDRARALLPGAEQLACLDAEIRAIEEKCADAFASGYIAESPDKLRRRLLQYFRAAAGGIAYPRISCNAPWVSAVVETDGTVRPCFFHRAYGRIGAEAGTGLAAALNAPAAVAWRAGLDVSSDSICQRCVCNLVWKEPAAPGREYALD